MTTKAKAAPAAKDTAATAAQAPERPSETHGKAGERGPASSLETGVGSTTGAASGADTAFEGKRGEGSASKGQSYSVQKHDDENGLSVEYVTAGSGDEAAQKVLASAKYKGTSIRGVTPASDPDPNSLGGERDASIMIHNADNAGDTFDRLGTEANREAVEGLGKADVKELGE